MKSENDRAHGVTPGLQNDYILRTANKQAAFFIPYLKKGMSVIDLGCGPGTITAGFARIVTPGLVTGIDHDSQHIEKANELRLKEGLNNLTFKTGDVLSLPYNDESFDAAFENNLFVHLADNSAKAAKEVFGLLKPGGFFGVRDVDVEYAIWGNKTEPIILLDKLMKAWQEFRGSNVNIGRHLPSILRKAGFTNCIKSVSADTKGTQSEIQSHAEITLNLIEGPLGEASLKNEWTDKKSIENIKREITRWGENPDSFFSNVHIEVIGWKPSP